MQRLVYIATLLQSLPLYQRMFRPLTASQIHDMQLRFSDSHLLILNTLRVYRNRKYHMRTRTLRIHRSCCYRLRPLPLQNRFHALSVRRKSSLIKTLHEYSSFILPQLMNTLIQRKLHQLTSTKSKICSL